MAVPQVQATPHNVAYKVVIATAFGVVISVVSVALRVCSKKVRRMPMAWDDYFIFIALAFKIGNSIDGIILLDAGLGRDLTSLSSQDITLYLKVLFTGTFIYTLTVTFTKLSILYLYRRLFVTRVLLQLNTILMLLVSLWCIVICTMGFFICVPLKKAWEPMIQGTCFNLVRFYYGIQIPNIVTDVAILVLPFRTLWHLPLPRSQRIAVSVIFSLGLLTTIFDIIRLVAILEIRSDNFTYTQTNGAIWTELEPTIGILVACLPVMRPLLGYFSRRRYPGTEALDSEDHRSKELRVVQKENLTGSSGSATLPPPSSGPMPGRLVPKV